jgi:hypothetical protein
MVDGRDHRLFKVKGRILQSRDRSEVLGIDLSVALRVVAAAHHGALVDQRVQLGERSRVQLDVGCAQVVVQMLRDANENFSIISHGWNMTTQIIHSESKHPIHQHNKYGNLQSQY